MDFSSRRDGADEWSTMKDSPLLTPESSEAGGACSKNSASRASSPGLCVSHRPSRKATHQSTSSPLFEPLLFVITVAFLLSCLLYKVLLVFTSASSRVLTLPPLPPPSQLAQMQLAQMP